MRAWAMYNAMVLAVATFASPTVAMATFLGLIKALEAAQTAALTKAKGLASARDVERDSLWTAMESLRTYVQGLADVLPAKGAIALIESAGLLVAEVASHDKPILQAKQPKSGVGLVHLLSNATLLAGRDASKKITFNWCVSTDGGLTWTNLPSTPFSDTEVENLTLMVEYQFRVSVTIGKVVGNWTEAVHLLVR